MQVEGQGKRKGKAKENGKGEAEGEWGMWAVRENGEWERRSGSERRESEVEGVGGCFLWAFS